MRCQIIEGWFASNNNIDGLYQAAFRFIATTPPYRYIGYDVRTLRLEPSHKNITQMA